MNHEQTDQGFPKEAQILLGLATVAAVVLSLPSLLIGGFLGLLVASAQKDKTANGKGVATTFLIWLVLTSVILLGFNSKIPGVLFTDLKIVPTLLAQPFINFVNAHFSEKRHISTPNFAVLRFYGWLSWFFILAVLMLAKSKKTTISPRIFSTLKSICTRFNNFKYSGGIQLKALGICYLICVLLMLRDASLAISWLFFSPFFFKYSRATIRKFSSSHHVAEGEFAIGSDIETGLLVSLNSAQLNHHVHVVGASGFGKSVLLTHLIRNQISQKGGLLFIDLKADIETIEEVQSIARSCGRIQDLVIFSCGNPEMSNHYNILKSGTANQLKDRLMTSLEWSDEFYKAECDGALLKILNGFCCLRDKKGETFDLFSLYESIENLETLESLSLKLGSVDIAQSNIIKNLHAKLKTPENSNNLQGLKSQLESLLFSDFGNLFKGENGGIDIFEAIKNQKIVYILLDSRRYGQSARTLGKIVIEDLKSTSARIDSEIRKDERRPFSVIIDEFSDMATESFIGFLDRARSAKIGITVAHQELADLDRISPEFKTSLMNSTSTTFAFLQKNPTTSELLAGIAGTRSSTAETERAEESIFGNRMSGQKSVRITEEYIIHPNVIRQLEVGECVLIEKYPKSRARKIRINRPGTTADNQTIEPKTLINAKRDPRLLPVLRKSPPRIGSPRDLSNTEKHAGWIDNDRT